MTAKEKFVILLKWFCKFVLAGLLTAVVLSLFVLVYNFSSVHIDNKDGATDYKWGNNSFFSTAVEGFAFLRSDENGYNNSYSPKKDSIDILLMGSSHMEALNVASNKNAGYLLNELIPEYYTYNIGVSGHTIYRCVHNFESAVNVYNPQKYVIIETDNIALDEEEMNNVISGSYKKIESYDSGIMFYIQKYIPVVKSVYKKLDEWNSKQSDDGNNENSTVENEVEESKYLKESYKNTLNEFLSFLNKSDDIKVIIVYQPSTAIDENGNYVDKTDKDALRVFSDTCKANNIVFVDLIEDFKLLYENENVLAHGFYNTGVGVGHLNEEGHRVFAERLNVVINQEENDAVK